jgi:hypothetical protein
MTKSNRGNREQGDENTGNNGYAVLSFFDYFYIGVPENGYDSRASCE